MYNILSYIPQTSTSLPYIPPTSTSLPYIPQTSTSLPYIPQRSGSSKNVSRFGASTGFTLLQGHIQLMAMVPNLPENELSPRSSRKEGRESSAGSSPRLDSSGARITPRLMPSATKFQRTRLPTQSSFNQYQSPASWHAFPSPRTVSNLSLPPKPAKPIAMPSFGRHLPGTARIPEGGMFQYSSSPFQPTASSYGYEAAQVPSLPPTAMSSYPQQHTYMYLYTAGSTGSAAPSDGPESVPIKVPSKTTVVDTASQVESVCKDNELCAACQRCLEKERPPSEESQPEPVETPKKKTKGVFTPRRNPKSVVVAVHDCFPSDSSISEEEDSYVDVPIRKSILNKNNSCPSTLRNRKPRMGKILHKTRTKCGETAEVFDVLYDLNPDEVRLFTCEYLVELLSSSDWSNCHLGLETMVRLARHRPKILLNYLGPILWYAFKHLTSPKSALCRAAIVTFTELFKRIGSALDNDLEKLTEKLVVKSLAPNMFLREECDRALEAMVNHCDLIKVLVAIESVSKKINVRVACHRLAGVTKQFIKVAGVDTCLKPTYAEKILPMLFNFMTEANIQTRTAAKEALAMLMNHLQFEAAVTRHVTFDKNCTEVFKKLDKMRGRKKSRVYPIGH